MSYHVLTCRKIPHILPFRLRCCSTVVILGEQVYPIGIPLIYALILWKHRHSLNPIACRSDPLSGAGQDEPERLNECDDEAFSTRFWRKLGGLEEGRAVKALSSEEKAELEERINKRINDPDLVPSMFLWKDFGEMFPLVTDALIASNEGLSRYLG